MKIFQKKLNVAELVDGYRDDNEGGVFAYGGNLVCRPKYQREFVYDNDMQAAVIDTVLKGYPLNIMYWAKRSDGRYEIIDGQQRTMSICRYISGGASLSVNIDGNAKFFHNLTDDERNRLLNYDLMIFLCEGTDSEKLAWFKTINTGGLKLTDQELLNSVYTGAWLTDAKRYFSKMQGPAQKPGSGYIFNKRAERQEYLELILKWAAARDHMSLEKYMATHQNDEDAEELFEYYKTVLSWAKTLFSQRPAQINKQDWGYLYEKYHMNTYDPEKLEEELKRLILDKDVEKKDKIIPYLLSDRSMKYEKDLKIRDFDDEDKMTAYEKQGGICPICGQHFEYNEMEGDHIVPWSKGGKTELGNLQMLCMECNRKKSNNVI